MRKVFYSLIAKFYDAGISIYLEKGENNPRQIVARLIDGNAKTLLDVCAGTCQNSIAIAREHKDIEIIAVDQSEKMLDAANQKIDKNNISNIKTIVMDATKLEFEDNAFDVVVISLALHELSEELQQAILYEIYRVVKDGGKLFVVEWNPQKKTTRKIKFLPIQLMEPSSYKRFVKQDMNEYFDNVGFEIEDTISCAYTKVYSLKKKK